MELALSRHSLAQQETHLKVLHRSTAFPSLTIILMLIHTNRQGSNRTGIRSIYTHGKEGAEGTGSRSSRQVASEACCRISSNWHCARRQSQCGSRCVLQAQSWFHGCSTLSYRRAQVQMPHLEKRGVSRRKWMERGVSWMQKALVYWINSLLCIMYKV